MGTAVGDYDNDGDLDLFVTSFGPETLYRNNGDGTFTDVTAQAGVSDPLWSASAAFRRLRPGRRSRSLRRQLPRLHDRRQQVVLRSRSARATTAVRGRIVQLPDRLYRNDGNGRFSDVTESAGISKADGAGLGVVAGDYNGDGWLDIYVANDATSNQLWINRRDGTFADDGRALGRRAECRGQSRGQHGHRLGRPRRRRG